MFFTTKRELAQHENDYQYLYVCVMNFNELPTYEDASEMIESANLTSMDIQLFFSTFALIFVSELPDKTAFATLLMAAKGKPLPIFIGVALAFLVQTGVAVAFGSVIAKLPHQWVHILAGILFLVFALVSWRKTDPEDLPENSPTGSPEDLKNPTQNSAMKSPRVSFLPQLWSSFLVIFIAEWGDLTQLATASLAAHSKNLFTIFFAALLALWSVTALAIIVGSHAKKLIHPQVMHKVAAVAFAIVGIYFLGT